MSDEKDLPETPFNGLVVGREISNYSDGKGGTGTKMSLLIIPEDDTSEDPATVVYSYVLTSDPEPWLFLREGHKVRIRNVIKGTGGFSIANSITLNISEIGAKARDALPKAPKQAATEEPGKSEPAKTEPVSES
jgi:hypothetical protein